LPDESGWGFSGNEVTLAIAELEYKYACFDAKLPGAVDVGLAYASGGEALGITIPSVFGCYIQFEQLIYRENPSDAADAQGLGVFASYFPRFPSSPIPVTAISDDVVGGVVYKGLILNRDADVIGVGAAWAKLNQGGTRQETAVEVFYKAQITPSKSIQPDIQYVISPSGIHRDALVVGVRFQVAL
jgi:carbohydrate-selective porin OprB